MGWLERLLGIAGGAAPFGLAGGLLAQGWDRLDQMKADIMNEAGGLYGQYMPPEFRAFGMTSGTGSAWDPMKGLSLSGADLDMFNRQMDQARALGTSGQEYLQRAMGDYGQYRQDAYDALRAVQIPEEQRRTNAMTSNLTGTGRLGMTSGAFGGSAEQFANSKAMAEAQNAAAAQAYQMGQTQQAQDLGAANSLFAQALGQAQGAYTPQATMASLMPNATNMMNMYNQYGLGSSGQALDFLGSALNNKYNLGVAGANLLGNLGSGLFTSLLSPPEGGGESAWGSLWDKILGN